MTTNPSPASPGDSSRTSPAAGSGTSAAGGPSTDETRHETRTESAHETALVAGGSRGFGLTIARDLASRGYRVAVCARDAEELDRARDLVAKDGITLLTSVVDVTDAAAVQRWVDEVDDPRWPIGVAISVAGVIQVGSIEAATPAIFDECIDIMTKGPAYLALAVLPGMRARRRGRIGIVSSVGGVVAPPHLVPYATAKFGAAGLGQGLHAELAGTGVTVTTIMPPPMRTGSHLHAQFAGNRSAEYAWFAPAAALPGLSLEVGKAARRTVDATLAGKVLTTLSPISELALRAQGLAPSLTVRALGLAGRLLPGGTESPMAGRDVRASRTNKLVDAATTAGDRTAERTNESHPASTDPTH